MWVDKGRANKAPFSFFHNDSFQIIEYLEVSSQRQVDLLLGLKNVVTKHLQKTI